MMFESNESRRDFLKKTAYVAPLILTMNVSLAQAQAGSAAPGDGIEEFSAGGADGASVGGSQPLELGSSGWSGDYEGNGDPGKHTGWYKPWYKWLDEREDHLINRGD
jgi:hypothetical protein